jgi:hypothetical protein
MFSYGLSLQMAAFSIAAKLTHMRYGISSMPEAIDILKKIKIVQTIAIQNIYEQPCQGGLEAEKQGRPHGIE